MSKLFSLLLVVSILLISNSVQAGFITKYSDWRDLNASEKRAFVMGVYDTNHSSTGNRTKDETANIFGIDVCGSSLNLGSAMLADAVDAAYLRNPQRWGNMGVVMVHGVLHHMCLNYINNFRQKFKLKPLKPWENWK